MRKPKTFAMAFATTFLLFLNCGCKPLTRWWKQAHTERSAHLWVYAIDLTASTIDKQTLFPKMATKLTGAEVAPGDEVHVLTFGGSGQVYTPVSAVSLTATGNNVFDHRLALVSYAEINKAVAQACAMPVVVQPDRTSDQFAILAIAKDIIAADQHHRRGVICLFTDGFVQTPALDTRSVKLNTKAITTMLRQLRERDRLPDLAHIDLVIAGAPGHFDVSAGAVTDLFFGLKLFWTEAAAQMHANLRGFGQIVPALGYAQADR